MTYTKVSERESEVPSLYHGGLNASTTKTMDTGVPVPQILNLPTPGESLSFARGLLLTEVM